MPDLIVYKGLSVVDSPTGVGGAALTDDFKNMVDWHPKSVWAQTTDPGNGNNQSSDFYPGSLWLNTTASPAKLWLCSASTTTTATWLRIAFV